MIYNYRKIAAISALVNIVPFVGVVWFNVSNAVNSQNLIARRKSGLEDVTRNLESKTCWVKRSQTPYKIGDVVDTEGSAKGKIPTTCVLNTSKKQYLYVSYEGGVLKVSQIYSQQEVANQRSQFKLFW